MQHLRSSEANSSTTSATQKERLSRVEWCPEHHGAGGQFPCTVPTTLLSYSPPRLPNDWKRCPTDSTSLTPIKTIFPSVTSDETNCPPLVVIWFGSKLETRFDNRICDV